MPDTPDGTTANRIRMMIDKADVFLFLATNDSMTSVGVRGNLGWRTA